ncbi:hypothetical protein HOD20_07785 [archaeon]|jgi:hypothetical protein|nr:hypothetical protein [archaeon]MBT4352409.1 hypothetical protein [archaeon]MBT4648449.1 hypothetical protein [archaeon]MBT6821743.1 hypothetical protein [archaeon]MBT7391227.1 hypothetical protein [archaeon]
MLDLVLGDVEGPDIHKKEEFDPHARYCPNCKNKLKKKDFCDVCNQKIDFLKETSEKIDKKIKEEKGKLKRIYR